MSTRRDFILSTTAGGLVTAAQAGFTAQSPAATDAFNCDGPDPIFEKPDPLSLADLAKLSTSGVSAVEVNDYAPGRYPGPLTPSPPHADLNPKKAIIVVWKDGPCRLVFSHEASYIPILELSDGTGMCTDYFGNDFTPESGESQADIMNIFGRKEKNNFVDIVKAGPGWVWVRWTYLATSKSSDADPRFRGLQDYLSFPNGLTLCRLTFRSLMPDSPLGYGAGGVVDLYGVLAHGMKLRECFAQDSKFGDMNVLSLMDLYSDHRFDFYWNERYWNDKQGRGARRVGAVDNGDDDVLGALNESKGCALVIPFRKRLLFVVLGAASGFDPKHSQFIDGSVGPVSDPSIAPTLFQDHWPIGWSNYANSNDRTGPYVFHFGNLSQNFVPEGQRIKHLMTDQRRMATDMAFNKWVEKRIFYSLWGSAADWSEIRRIGREWLATGAQCARPSSVASIRT